MTSRMPKKGKTGDSRANVVSAARDLLMTDGYDAVQPAAVALRAGVTKKEIDGLFKTRERLVEAALEFHWSEIKPFIDQVFAREIPPLDRFQKFFFGAGEFQKHHAGRVGCVVGCLLLRVGSSVPRGESAIRKSLNDKVGYLQKLVEGAVRDAQAQGLVRKGDPSAKAWTVVHYLEGMLGIARIDGNLTALEGAWDRVQEFLGTEVRATP